MKIFHISNAYLIRKSLSELLIEEFNQIEVYSEIEDFDFLSTLLQKESSGIIIVDKNFIKKYERYIHKIPKNFRIILIKDEIIRDDFNLYEYFTIYDDRKHIIETIQREINKIPQLSNEKKRLKGLSDREKIILQLIAKGCSSKTIAENLNISIQTVATHRKNISNKLEIKTVSGLTLYAIVNNLIKPEDTNLI